MTAVIIGCGNIAPLHIESLKAAGVRILALCDVRVERAAALIEKHGLDCAAVGSFEGALALNPDCVHICTPHYLHAPMVIAALERGIHVFTEKPLCISTAELRDIERAAQASPAQVGVCFQNRYTPAAIEAVRLAEGATGGYCSVQWKRDKAYYESGAWRGKKATEGGGVLINQAIHTLDLLAVLLGEPKFVTAHTYNYTHGDCMDVEDTAEGLIEFERGVAPFYATVSGVGNLPTELLVEGEHELRLSGRELFVDGQLAVLPDPLTIPGKEYWGSAHPAIIRDFYDCLASGRAFPVGVTEGGRTVRLIEAIYASNGQRRQIV